MSLRGNGAKRERRENYVKEFAYPSLLTHLQIIEGLCVIAGEAPGRGVGGGY